MIGTFYKKVLQKINQKKIRIKKLIKVKGKKKLCMSLNNEQYKTRPFLNDLNSLELKC